LNDQRFILVGRLAEKKNNTKDIDLVVPLPQNLRALDIARTDLAGLTGGPISRVAFAPFEELAVKAGKPVDLFLDPPTIGRQLAACWSPDDGEGWVVFDRHLDRAPVLEPVIATFTEIVELAQTIM
jgi:hypothetical protein